MKFLLAFAVFTLSFSSFAGVECSDPNLSEVTGVVSYGEVIDLESFKEVGNFKTAAPAGFKDIFNAGGELCRDVRATYLIHESGTPYVIYTTQDDYCDGGNTIGIMINMKKYSDEGTDLMKSVVGTIGDSEFYCK